MSKHILLNSDVTNLIVKDLVGPNAVDQYVSQASEWPTRRILSNVLYSANNSKKFPPIIAEVIHVMDISFLHQIVQYCEEVNLRYGAVPLVLIFVVEKIQSDIISNIAKHPKLSFLLQVPSFPWARGCFVISENSMWDYMNNTPLHPLVALGIFFTARSPYLFEHDQQQDPTIQKLYHISKQLSENTIADEEITNDILRLCDDSELRLQESVRILSRLKDTSAKKRAIACLNDGIETIESYKRKYIPSQSREQSPWTSLSSQSSLSPVAPSLSSGNWDFVENFVNGLGTKKMNWKACYSEGQRQGYFASYTTYISLKNSYQRWKKQRGSLHKSRK
ncbi:hypothetical protein BD560DRAFT_390728 [Blakeslea trispora]|nr:hypothetical protein BD560DRAFT_390728 [Blakeslea trispora]